MLHWCARMKFTESGSGHWMKKLVYFEVCKRFMQTEFWSDCIFCRGRSWGGVFFIPKGGWSVWCWVLWIHPTQTPNFQERPIIHCRRIWSYCAQWSNWYKIHPKNVMAIYTSEAWFSLTTVATSCLSPPKTKWLLYSECLTLIE